MKKTYITNLIRHLEERYPEEKAPPEIATAIRRMKAAYEKEARLREICAQEGLRLPDLNQPVVLTFGAAKRHTR